MVPRNELSHLVLRYGFIPLPCVYSPEKPERVGLALRAREQGEVFTRPSRLSVSYILFEMSREGFLESSD